MHVPQHRPAPEERATITQPDGDRPAGGRWDELLPASEPVQLLAPDGTFTPSPRYPLDLPPETLLRLHELMVVSRRVDREAIALQRQGQLALHLSCAGQEAAQVGSATALDARDWIFPQGRELAVAITRGLDPADLLHVWRGTWHSHHDLHRHRFAPMTIPIGTQALHAVGFAMAARLDRADVCAVCYVGDGATSVGDVHEALNFAGVYGAPVVLFVQNNQWALSVPLRGQCVAPTLAHKGIGYGIPGIQVDGNDVLACLAVTRWALERARTGGGPVLIEALTYRIEGHSTADDPTRYRPAGELERWQALDPLLRMERHLTAGGLLDDDAADGIRRRAEQAAMALRAALVDAPAPDPEQLFAHVYADEPATLAEQREQLRREGRGQPSRPPGPRR